MAVFNEILSGRFNRALQKLLSMKGPPPTPQLASEFIPVLPLFWGVENRYLEGWDKFGRVVDQVAGGVGNRSGVRLRNPITSHVVGVVERWNFFLPSGAASADLPSWLRNVGNGDLTLATMLFTRMDARSGGPISGQSGKQPSLVLSQTGALGAQTGTALFQGPCAIGGSTELILADIQEIPILPGDDITVQSLNTNTEILCSINWRERVLEDSELS